MSDENVSTGQEATLETQIEGILDETPENTEVIDNPESSERLKNLSA